MRIMPNTMAESTESGECSQVSAREGVTTLAGSGEEGFADAEVGADALFCYPSGVCVDGAGNVYVADHRNQRIRKITPAGATSTLAGSGAKGSADAEVGADAQFDFPHGVCVDGAGNVYVADAGNQRIRKITPAGATSTLAGSRRQGFADAEVGADAQFDFPHGVCVDRAGNVYVADRDNHRIRKISSSAVC